MIERLKRSKYIDEIILYVQDNSLNKKAIDLAKKYGLNIYFLGEDKGTHDQIVNFRKMIGDYDIEISIPIIPLIDPEIIGLMVE